MFILILAILGFIFMQDKDGVLLGAIMWGLAVLIMLIDTTISSIAKTVYRAKREVDKE